METIVMNVTGMKCGGCEMGVKQGLEAVAGVEKAVPNHKLGKVEVGYQPSEVTVEQMQAAIEALGYAVQPD